MSEEYDETDEETEQEIASVEDGEEEEDLPLKKQTKPVGRPVKQQAKPQQIKDRYVAGSMPKVIFIKDNMREGDESIVAEQFNDVGTAMAMAKIMNDLDKVMTAQGS